MAAEFLVISKSCSSEVDVTGVTDDDGLELSTSDADIRSKCRFINSKLCSIAGDPFQSGTGVVHCDADDVETTDGESDDSGEFSW